MKTGILYESREWSIFALRDRLKELGAQAILIDMLDDINPDELLSCDLIVNRVFASAVFRGHEKAHAQMPEVIGLLEKHGVPMINPAEAHYYEISKRRSKEALISNGFPVPELYDIDSPKYPCVVKPDCGGRTNYTFIVNDEKELSECLADAPDILFIAEEYIRPEYGFVTRVEIIGRECRLAVKRSVTEGGLSAYRLGSEFEIYADLPDKIKDTAIRVMDCLSIEAGSLDIIENASGFYIIDVNTASNVSEDNTGMFDFDLMKEMAVYIINK